MHSHPTQTQYCPERPDMRNIPFILLSSLPFLFHLHAHCSVHSFFIPLLLYCPHFPVFLLFFRSLSTSDVLALPDSKLCCLIRLLSLLPIPFFRISSSLLPSSPIALLPQHIPIFLPILFTPFFSAPQAIPYLTTYLLPRQLQTIQQPHTHTTSEFTLLSGGSLFTFVTKNLWSADLLLGQ